jgi:NAD(P)-dependent dehydrogenase (short-subunit alcohol dehydrogenase family)
MVYDLSGKVALVTGATRGIGRAIALAYARSGCTVIITSRKDEAVSSVVTAFRADGHSAVGIPANVGRPGEPQRLVERALAECGGVDLLVNNAAANPVYGPMAETSLEAFDKIIDVNLKAPFLLGKLLLHSMRARGGGVVLNIASIGAISPEQGLGIYSVSKAALVSLTRVMAREWGTYNVRANAICPGFIKTEFSAVLWRNEATLDAVLRDSPISRIGTPADVAGLALYLSSDAASFCTGGVYTVDGGYTI